MNRQLYLVAVILVAAQLACQIPVGTPAPSPTPALTTTPTVVPTATAEAGGEAATVQATVYVRQSADANSPEVGSLTTGALVEIIACDGQWCEIRTDVLSGFVFRGCLSDNPDGLKCEARP